MQQFKSFTESNKAIKLDQTPKRVAVLGFPAYDTLKALGLEDLIVAAPKDLVPDYIHGVDSDVEDTESLHNPDLDVVRNANPDLIIATSRNAKCIDDLQEIAPVFKYATVSSSYWESFVEINRELAKIFDKENEFESQLAELDQLIKDIQDFNQDTNEETAMLMLSKGKFTAFDDESRFAFIFQELNFKPVSSFKDKAHGEALPADELEELDPDRIFVIDRTEVVAEGEDKQLLDKDAFQNTRAYKDGKVSILTPDLWYLGSGGLDASRLQLQEIKNSL